MVIKSNKHLFARHVSSLFCSCYSIDWNPYNWCLRIALQFGQPTEKGWLLGRAGGPRTPGCLGQMGSTAVHSGTQL